MSRGGLRFGEADFQQLVARTRGVATSVGGLAPAEARVIAPAPVPAPAAVDAPPAAPARPAKAPRARPAGPPKISEDDLQISCFEWIELMRPSHPILEWIIHVPNGGKRPRGAAGKLKAMGVKPGVLDILLPLPYNGWSGLAIELKVGSNKTTEQQDDWLEVLQASGYYTAVCYTLEAFMDHVSRFLTAAAQAPSADVAIRQAAYLSARRSRAQN
ncbi:VRR-NUC domain-containing protein [Massilia varians]|uniref:VRR-NUC domain-containing protein n=1 Tax=Massilia varians TaxID=457921 RepID=UPI002552394A|nr:VRR-NUC domain-containing protein [Massilia varians]MDK6079792.1 VRR-NUC domain-containing protein [Massilia varians]